jgi:hypothetical protein
MCLGQALLLTASKGSMTTLVVETQIETILFVLHRLLLPRQLMPVLLVWHLYEKQCCHCVNFSYYLGLYNV